MDVIPDILICIHDLYRNGNIIQRYLRIIKMILLLFLFCGNHWLPFPLFSFTIIVFLCFRNIIEEVAEIFVIEDDPQFVKTMFSDSIDIGESS